MIKIIKSKKGFTMIELLAAVLILGILSVLAIGSVQILLDKSEEEYYLNQEKNIELAAQTYFQNNRNALPKSIGQEEIIYLKDLQDTKYIEMIKDRHKNNCNRDTSYVKIIKYTKSDYKYIVYLDCGDEYKTKLSTRAGGPTAEISYPLSNDTIKNVNATATITGGNNDDDENPKDYKLVSYSYIIYKKSSSGQYQEVKNSGSVSTRKKTQTIPIPLDNYLPGHLKIQLTAINENGEKVTVTKESDYSDLLDPLCPNKEDENYKDLVIGENSNWSTASLPRTITIICQDQANGSECARPYYSQTFTEEAQYGKITLYDKAGNSSECTVDLYADTTKPTLTINVRDGGATGTIIKTITANDGAPNQSLDTGWLNGNYPNGLYIEYIANDKVGLDNLSYARNNEGLKANSAQVNTYNTPTTVNIDGAKNKTGGFLITNEGYHKTQFTLKDLSGKETTINLTTPYDKTKPTVSITLTKSDGTTYTSGSLTDKDVVRKITATDAMSGISNIQHNSDGSWKEVQYVDSYTYNSSTTTTLTVRTIDVAGNVSESKTVTIKIEKNPDKNLASTCKRTCSGYGCSISVPSYGTYYNDRVWQWDFSGAGSGIKRSTMRINYSTEYVTDYCIYYASTAPDGSRSGCGKAVFTNSGGTGKIVYSRSYAKSSIIGRACTNNGVCTSCKVTN